MLNQGPDNHLSADQLLQALADLPDPGTERRTHLDQCPACRKELERMQRTMGRLGRTARQMAPAPTRPFRLPPKDAPAAWWRFKPMWATVAAGALLFAFTVWWPRPLTPPGPVQTVAARHPAADGFLLDQVDALVDDALPPTLKALAVASDLGDADDELDWLVPPVDDAQNDDSWI
jgi:hypothetical protein